MDPRSNRSQAPEGAAVTVTATSLNEAYRRIKAEFGADAVILDTRSVMRPSDSGLGVERAVEMTVARGQTVSAPQKSRDSGIDSLVDRLENEIERLENKVATLMDSRGQTIPTADADDLTDGLNKALMERGTHPETAALLAARFRAENSEGDAGFPAWLTGQMKTADCTWEQVEGLHAVVGPSGSGRTRLVLAAAARVSAVGGRALVLSVSPDHPGEIRRLQTEAAAGDFDAAVIRRPEQVVELEGQLSDYQAVFIDLPPLENSAMEPGGELHSWLAGHHGIHRHLLVPMDLDPAEIETYPASARELNVDWLALGRLDRASRTGKILNLIEAMALPVSLMAGTMAAKIATGDSLSDLVTRGMEFSRADLVPENSTVVEEGR